MNKGRAVAGCVILVVTAIYFFFAPAFVISDGTEIVLWLNVVPGLLLAMVGISLLATGLRGKTGKA